MTMLPIRKTAASLSAATIASVFLTLPAYAEPTGYDQLTFQTEVKQEVENDEVTAILYTTDQADDAKTLANTLNVRINRALAIAKRYPNVEVSTGQQNIRPQYDKEGLITGWTGRSSITLKSDDFSATSELIADLQEVLVMERINFRVSDTKQDTIQKQLMMQASREFQEQARSLVSTWGASNYRVLSVSLNAGNRYYPTPVAVSARAEMSVDSSVAPRFEAGNSTISVVANGTIELTR